MDPIYRGEDIRIDFTVTANALDSQHDYSGATFRLDLSDGTTFPVTVDSAATKGEATLHLDLSDTDTSALDSIVYQYKLWCVEGSESQVVDYGSLAVI